MSCISQVDDRLRCVVMCDADGDSMSAQCASKKRKKKWQMEGDYIHSQLGSMPMAAELISWCDGDQ